MSDCKELDKVMEHVGITPKQVAKEKAKAVFLLKIDEKIENGKGNKEKFWNNKRLLYSFVSGMAAMLFLMAGFLSVFNPEFLSGAVRTEGYYEINSPYVPFKNGDVISSDTLTAMKDSGNKFKLYIQNGIVLYLDTLDAEPVTINYDLTPDATLEKLFQSAAGGSIITLKIESGFTGMPIKYEIDLNSLNEGVLNEMDSDNRQKWLSGLYVYCYIVDRDQLNQYNEIGRAEAIIDKKRMLPSKIVGQSIYVNTDPFSFNEETEMLMFTLQKIENNVNND